MMSPKTSGLGMVRRRQVNRQVCSATEGQLKVTNFLIYLTSSAHLNRNHLL
jgi:hypothetical protein